MSEIEVKHYKRTHKGEREKSLVIERVTSDSETAQFLQQLEVKRLTRACQLTLDMRGKVPGACRSYLINNKVFYLDDISLAILNKGLKENNRQFTVGIYEAIANGAHTNRAMRLEQERKLAQVEPLQSRRRAAVASIAGTTESVDSSATRNQGPRYYPDVILSGYYKKRREDRLQYVTSVTLVIDGMPYSAKTRDLSLSGIQVYLKGAYNFQTGQSVQASFTDIQEAFGIEGLVDVPYQVISVTHKSQEVTLRLARVPDRQEQALDGLMQRLVDRLSQKYKCDVDDDLLSVNATIHERLYTDNVTHIPLFFSRDAAGKPRLKRVAATERNQSLLEFFNNGRSGTDFSPLALPARLARLLDGESPGDMLVIMYRNDHGDDGTIHSAADFEFEDVTSLRAFMRHAMVHARYCMLKLTAIGLRKPGDAKVALHVQRLHDKSKQDKALIMQDFESLIAVGMAVDVSKELAEGLNLLDRGAKSLEGRYDTKGLNCWVGMTRKVLDTGEKIESLSAPVDTHPDSVKFGYLERRREERYMLQTQVDIAFKGRTFSGVTQDISVRGLQAVIVLDKEPELQVGDTVYLDFVGLQGKVSNVKLKDIEYRIANIMLKDKLRLRLERVINRQQEDINGFFVDIINRNRHKLPVDIEETLYAAKSRLHESILAENLISIPFFMAKDDDGAVIVQKLALNETPCRLAGFFRQSDGNYDLGPLIETKRVYYLYDGVSLIARKESVDGRAEDSIETYIYMYREPAQSGRAPVLRSLADFEESEEVTREQFLRDAVKSGNYCFIKVIATPISEMHNLEVDRVIEDIRENSRYRAFKLKESFQRIIAQGEIIDVTAQVLATFDM
jgi:c-di-GMP-binding flagellar brake protein YcgR